MKLVRIFFGICLALIGMDVVVSTVLTSAERRGTLGSLVQYFEYGRSVPGKLARWEEDPNARGNLYDVAWLDELVTASARVFGQEQPPYEPIVRTYGMSFVNNITEAAKALAPALKVDGHGGPAAAPNFTYAAFQEDRDNRRPGDIVILGVLSSSLSGLASFSNQHWAFEQPAPFTAPIYLPDEASQDLTRIDPVIQSAAMQRRLPDDRDLQRQWRGQIDQYDALWSHAAFDLPMLDRSPFMRLVRRSLATSAIQERKDAVFSGAFPYAETLRRMVRLFAETARADGQIPVVFLIQARDLSNPNLLEITEATLRENGIAYLATEEVFSSRNSTGFVSDGHYKAEVDALFAQSFLNMPEISEHLGR